MTGIGADWRVIDGVPTAWFEAPSLTAGATLAGRIADLSPAVDLRATGTRVRLDSGEHAAAVSAAARDLGLTANPSALRHLSVVIGSAGPAAVRRFWRGALGYAPGRAGDLVDPLRRDPPFRIRRSARPRPLRNRIHLDVVRPAAVVERTGLGPYEVCHADPDGNEADLVPGEPLGDEPGTADWQTVFSAMACYRITAPAQQRDLAAAAAVLAVDAGFPLLIDLRPGLVILDSGKDRWADDFIGLATALQATARDAGATADPALPRFVQLFLDAADVAAVRAFWAAALGYTPDRREGVTDIHDPRWLNPVLVFQELDAADTERRAQRNRIHVELAVPPDAAPERLAAIVAAGGRLLGRSGNRWRIADPEGNDLVVTAATARRTATP